MSGRRQRENFAGKKNDIMEFGNHFAIEIRVSIRKWKEAMRKNFAGEIDVMEFGNSWITLIIYKCMNYSTSIGWGNDRKSQCMLVLHRI